MLTYRGASALMGFALITAAAMAAAGHFRGSTTLAIVAIVFGGIAVARHP